MIIRDFKRKIISVSVGLIIIGFIISLVGFGISGFDFNKLKSNDGYKWYRTINVGENFSPFPIEF